MRNIVEPVFPVKAVLFSNQLCNTRENTEVPLCLERIKMELGCTNCYLSKTPTVTLGTLKSSYLITGSKATINGTHVTLQRYRYTQSWHTDTKNQTVHLHIF